MKNSINNAFKVAKKENRPALISYTVCGDNTKDKSLQILNSISKDLDIAEWGIPHNCPTADGKVLNIFTISSWALVRYSPFCNIKIF